VKHPFDTIPGTKVRATCPKCGTSRHLMVVTDYDDEGYESYVVAAVCSCKPVPMSRHYKTESGARKLLKRWRER
jgi:hypothetical protein